MQKSEISEDVRVRRTRKLLQQAFIELTVEKGFAALTVRDITKRAMVNRSTFYRHYLDKYDLLDQYMNEIYEMSEGRTPLTGTWEPTFHEVLSGSLNLLKHIQQFADFYRVMLSAQGYSLFAQRFRQNIEKAFLSCLARDFPAAKTEPDAPPFDLKLNFVAYACAGATIWWLEQEQACSPEQFAIWLDQLTRAIAGLSSTPK